MKSVPLFALICVVALTLGSCKPTEGNYQSAYDAALAKRNQTDPDADILYGNHKLSSTLGATPQTEGTDTLLVLRTPAKLINATPEAEANRYHTAIAFYRMEANATDHAARLAAAGETGTAVAKLGDEKYLVLIHSAPSLKDAFAYTSALRARSSGPWIGLTPPEPIVLVTFR